MKIYCRIPYEQELWNELSSEMNSSGKIIFEDGGNYIQVMPIDEFGFMPGGEQVIEIVLSLSYQLALGVMGNWLYDKLKQRKMNKIIINDETFELKDKEALEVIIASELEKNE